MKKLVELLVLLTTIMPTLVGGAIVYNNISMNLLCEVLILCLGLGLSLALMKIYEQASDIYDYEHDTRYKRQIDILNKEIENQKELIKKIVL